MQVPALECNIITQHAAKALANEVTAFDSLVDTIWSDSGFPVGVVRSAEFLNWRYDRPGNVYRRYVISDVGFLILKFYDRGTQKVVHICDLVLREHERGLCKSILNSVKSLAAQSGASLLTCWVPLGHPYRHVFEDVGFTRDIENDRFIFSTGPAKLLPILTNASNWHLSQGDSDVY